MTPTRDTDERKRRTGEEVRQALLEATLRVLASGDKPTTVRITREARVAQPNLYAYFDGLDDCVMAAVQFGVAKLKGLEKRRAQRFANQPLDVQALTVELRDWLEECRSTGPMYHALRRFQNQQTPAGKLVRKAFVRHRQSIADQLRSLAHQRGASPCQNGELYLQATLMIQSVISTNDMLQRGELDDVDMAARLLARNITAIMGAQVEAHGGSMAHRAGT